MDELPQIPMFATIHLRWGPLDGRIVEVAPNTDGLAPATVALPCGENRFAVYLRNTAVAPADGVYLFEFSHAYVDEAR